MAEFIYETPDGWEIRTGTDVNLVDPIQGLLLEIYNRMANLIAEGSGKPLMRNAVLNITAGLKDSIEFSAYADTIPVAIMGKKTSDGLFEHINATNTAGYDINAANYWDQLLLANLSGVNSTYTASYNFQQLLTGVGSNIEFTTGTYTQVIYVYIIPASSSSSTIQGMVQFTTSAGVDTYTDSGLSTIGTVAFVKYGQSFLDPSQFSITGSSITIDPGLPVEAGLQLLIVPFN